MLRQHVVVERLVLVVVIPVAQIDRRNAVDDALRDIAFHIVIIVGFGAQAEEHVAPHDRPEAVLLADRAHTLQMPAQQRKAVGLSVFQQILPQSHAVRLVHADVDAVCAHARAHRADLRLDERIRPLVVDHQDVHLVAQRRVVLPLQKLAHVSQRLDAGHQLHARLGRVSVQRPQVILRIASAQIAQRRVLRHLVGVLRVEHQQVHAQAGKLVDAAAHGLRLHHRAARAVHHRAAGGKVPLLAHGKRRPPLAHAAAQQEKAARKRIFVLRGDPGCAALQRHAKPLARRHVHRKRKPHARHALCARAGLLNRFRCKHGDSSINMMFLISYHYTGQSVNTQQFIFKRAEIWYSEHQRI